MSDLNALAPTELKKTCNRCRRRVGEILRVSKFRGGGNARGRMAAVNVCVPCAEFVVAHKQAGHDLYERYSTSRAEYALSRRKPIPPTGNKP